ncbi:MAG: ABC transporter ATP-binding protein [Labilithrix sp.]|nr:ABC transporter ATP-binding protein [Labilithrix sp.]
MSTEENVTAEAKPGPASTPPAPEPAAAPEPVAAAAEPVAAAAEPPAPALAAPTGYVPAPLEKASKTRRKKKDVEIAIRLTKITKRFGVKTAVDQVSLKVKAGSVYGLIGPNGAGKTTTFSMLAGFLRPTDGAIEVLGYEPTQIDELRSRLGVLPQDALLPPWDKVGEFLMHMAQLQDVPADRVEAEAREVLEEVDGREWWNLRCGQLSHGMAKRVQLAQALLGDPEIVLLDEPTAGLDPRVAYEVRQLIKRRKGRCTLVVSSHNLQELEEICDAACILDRGRVVASGSISELTAASEEVRIKLGAGPAPIAVVRELPMVKRVEFDEERRELVVYFDRGHVDAETVIGHVLWALLQNQARISGVTKGKGLEQRVMELT